MSVNCKRVEVVKAIMCILINIQGGFLQQPLFTESCHPPAAKHVIIHKTPGVAEFLHKHNFNPLSLSHSFSAFQIIYQFKQTSAIFMSNSLRWHVVCNQLPVKYYRSPWLQKSGIAWWHQGLIKELSITPRYLIMS